MKFVTVRELPSKTATIRQDLAQAKEIVLTANGRPFALMTPVNPDSVEEELQAIRRPRPCRGGAPPHPGESGRA